MSKTLIKSAGNLPVSLPDGLVIREVSGGDRDALSDLLASVHAGPDGTPNAAVKCWQRDLFDYGHPTATAAEVLVVEDLRTGALVASFMTVPQRWCYAEVPLEVSLWELAATRPDYRGRGLAKRLMEVLAARSLQRGDLIQGITDILFFQGDTGFQPALTQRAGRGGTARELPAAPAAGEPVKLRPAALSDIPLLAQVEQHAHRRALLACLRDEAQWRHELGGRSPESMVHNDLLVIEAPAGPIGYLVIGYGGVPSFPIPKWVPGLPCPEPVVSIARYELQPGAAWFSVTPSVLRQLTSSSGSGKSGGLDGYMLWLGEEHPAYDVLGDLQVRRPPHIGWFLRVPDMTALLWRIAPVLERRLVNTAAEAFTGELLLHFYRYGIHLRFSDGRLIEIKPWLQYSRRASDASLPEQMFLQVLFGHGTWQQLAPAFPDCRLQTNIGRLLLPLLFPKQASNIWPLI